jgi:hypothetical protein
MPYLLRRLLSTPPICSIGQGIGLSPLLSLAAPAAVRERGRGTLLLRYGLVVRVTFCQLWRVVGMVGGVSGNKSASILLLHLRRLSRKRLRVDGNVC